MPPDPLYFPLVDSFVYLGIIASYSNSESLTFEHRVSAAKLKKEEVRRFTNPHSQASNRTRLQVWKSTVQASLFFGLEVTGVIRRDALRTRSWIARQIRAIVRKPAHKSKLSTQCIFQLHNLTDPVEQLLDNVGNLLDALHNDNRMEPSIRTSPQILHYFGSLQQRMEQVAAYSSQAPIEEETYQCQTCHRTFTDRKALKTHQTSRRQTQLEKRSFDRLQHSQGAKPPTCKFCLHHFKAWGALRQHITNRACEAAEKALTPSFFS